MPSKVVILNDCMYCIFQNISFFLTNDRLIVPSHHCNRIVAPSHHRHRAIAPLFYRQRIITPSHYRPTARWNNGIIVNYMVLSGFHTSLLLHYWPWRTTWLYLDSIQTSEPLFTVKLDLFPFLVRDQLKNNHSNICFVLNWFIPSSPFLVGVQNTEFIQRWGWRERERSIKFLDREIEYEMIKKVTAMYFF